MVKRKNENDITAPFVEVTFLRKFYAALKGKKATAVEEVEWVKGNLQRPLCDIDVNEPPSYGAVIMLQWASENLDTFFTRFVAVALPNKAQIEAEEKLKDDGRALGLIEALDKEFHDARPQGTASQPGVSPADPGAWQQQQARAG